VQLAREAAPRGPAVSEELLARRRHADRVGVVAVRLEGAGAEECGDALDPGGARAEPDRVGARAARSFKTTRVDGR
jgi:hypothetical protein